MVGRGDQEALDGIAAEFSQDREFGGVVRLRRRPVSRMVGKLDNGLHDRPVGCVGGEETMKLLSILMKSTGRSQVAQ
jgi:hypothetical protein